MKFIEWYDGNRDKFDGLLLDIDGTLSFGGRAIGGAAELMGRVRGDGVPYYLLTNDGNHSLREKRRFLQKAGIPAEEREIISCASVLHLWAQERNFVGERFFILGELGKPDFAEEAGLEVCRDPGLIDECCGVIAGEGEYDWRPGLEGAMNFFRRHPERPFVVPNPDSYWPHGSRGDYGIGAGGQARFIVGLLGEMGIRLEPTYLGKPYPGIYRYALKRIEEDFQLSTPLLPERVLAIGDSLASDIRGANRFGMKSALVLTGITSSEQAQRAEGESRPDYIFDAIA